MQLKPTRRAVMAGIAGSAFVDMSALAQGALKLPTSPVSLNFVDVAGNLALTQQALETYGKAEAASGLATSPSPRRRRRSCRARSRRSRTPGASTSTCVLTGTDALSAGIDQKLWVQLLPDYAVEPAEAR